MEVMVPSQEALGLDSAAAPTFDEADLDKLVDNGSSDQSWLDCLLDDSFLDDIVLDDGLFDDYLDNAHLDSAQQSQEPNACASPNPSSSSSNDNDDNNVSVQVELKCQSPEVSSDNSTVVDHQQSQHARKAVKRHRDEASGSSSKAGEEDEKRKARLMRNRESAQLSRQRKKSYIEELEEKVKVMNSKIAELTNTVAVVSAENMQLRQQQQQMAWQNPSAQQHQSPPSLAPLVPPVPVAYPPPPWPPGGCYYAPAAPLVPPRISQVPLLPIPRLKSTPSAQRAANLRKNSSSGSPEQKPPPEKKIKKVRSVFFVGLFFFLCFVFGLTVPGTEPELELGRNMLAAFNDTNAADVYGGRVLSSVNEDFPVIRESQGDARGSEKWKRAFNDFKEGGKENSYLYERNISEPLAASLYVPRNDKLVKIDGNLIIHAVLASEKASELSYHQAEESKDGKGGTSLLKKEFEKNSLAVATQWQLARASDRTPGVLAPNSRSTFVEDVHMTAADISLHQWFTEGHAGPVLNSGMCTEIFQFESSSRNTPTMNSEVVTMEQSGNDTSEAKFNSTETSQENIQKNKILSAVQLPPGGAALRESFERNTTNHFEGAGYDGFHSSNHSERIGNERNYKGDTKSPSSMVVSVLVDPREMSDDIVRSTGRLPRIFVVVLIDSVKYVTYSCVLPSKGPITIW